MGVEILDGDCDCCGGSVTVPCCEEPIPATLCVTIENVSGAACFDGVEFQVQYNGAVGVPGWYNTGTLFTGTDNCCGSLFFYCDEDPDSDCFGNWVVVGLLSDECDLPVPDFSDLGGCGDTELFVTCFPFSIVGTFELRGGPLNGAIVTVTIAECP